MARKPTAEPTDEVGTTEVDEATLGRVLDCDAQEIRRYWRMGIIKRSAAKKYPLFPSIRFVLGHFRRLASGYGTGEAMRANAALRDSQRRLTDLRYDQLRGTLVSMAEIEAMWGELIQATQFLFRSIASRMRERAPDLSRDHYELLQELAQELLREVAIAGQSAACRTAQNDNGNKHADADAESA